MCKFPSGDQLNPAADERSSANTGSNDANVPAGIEMPVNSLISPIVSPLPRQFYARDAAVVARDLLGKLIHHGDRIARIVETEAYVQTYLRQPDLAAHSIAGITPRTRVIFGPPGHAYVYLSYGLHHCLNIVAEPDGTPGCVLIRAVEPIAGLSLPTNGPGKLTRALAIDLQHYGRDITQGDLILSDAPPPEKIQTSRRIGISKCPDFLLRFHIAGNPHVSR